MDHRDAGRGAPRKVLMITPHFPPDSSAGAHRVRLLAPYLHEFGWEPTVLTVDPAFIEGTLDPRLAALVPKSLRVERAPAFPVGLSRTFGFGDLGLRSMKGLYQKAVELLSRDPHDVLFITIYPAYSALLGPLLKRRFRLPFVIDYQDPWVGAWGDTVGGGPGGSADFKSRMSRGAGLLLEPHVVKSADAITAVSGLTIDAVVSRNPGVARIPQATMPIGGDRRDFDAAGSLDDAQRFFDPADGLFHLSHVGTILPLGIATLRAFLFAVAMVRDKRPDLYRLLRIHFLGSSNERVAGAPARALPYAREIGVEAAVTEHPPRLDYTDALAAQIHSSALLLLGSSEPHYTASRLYPALISGRPLIAVYHSLSSVSSILESGREPRVRLVQFGDADQAQAHVEEIANALIETMESTTPSDNAADDIDESYTARHLAHVLAGVFDTVTQAQRGPA